MLTASTCPLFLGLLGTLVTGTTAMGQIERGFNRIYGIEQDRPTLEKYGRALLLAVGAGTGLALAFLVFAFGRHSETWAGLLWQDLAVPALASRARRGDSRPRRVAAMGARPPPARLVVARVRAGVVRCGVGSGHPRILGLRSA